MLVEVIVPEVPWYVQYGVWISTILFIVAIFAPLVIFLLALDSVLYKSLLIVSAVSAFVLFSAAIVSTVYYNIEKSKWYEESASVFTESVVTPEQLKQMSLARMVTSSNIEIEAFPKEWIVHPTTGEYVKDYRVIIVDGRVVTVSGDEGGVLKQQIAEG